MPFTIGYLVVEGVEGVEGLLPPPLEPPEEPPEEPPLDFFVYFASAISLLFNPGFTAIALTVVVLLIVNLSVYFVLAVVGSVPSVV